jgi:hypothetical protein
MGDVLSFPGGDITHGGDPLLSGTRYIIAVFLLLEAGDGEKEGKGKGEGEGEEEGVGEGLLSGDAERSGQGVQGAVATSAVEGGMSVVTSKGEMGTMIREGDGEGEGESKKYSTVQNGQHRHDKVEGKTPVHGSINAEQMLTFIGSYLSLYILDDTFSFSSLPTQPHSTADLTNPPDNEKDSKLKPSICNTAPEKKELFSFCFDSFE